MLILDEADYWLPQSQQHAHVNRTRQHGKGRTLFVRLQNTWFNVVHRGRSLGLGIVVSSQRPANVDKRAIAVAEWKLLLKANMPQDLAVYKGFGVAPEVAMHLSRGQAYVLGPAEIEGVFQLRKRHSPDDAQTPGLHHLQRRAGQSVEREERETQRPMRVPRRAADDLTAAATRTLSLEKLIALLEAGTINERTLVMLMGQLPVVSQEPDEEGEEFETKESHPAQPEDEVLPDGVVAFQQKRRSTSALPADLQRAYDLYEEGLSWEKFAKRLDVSKATAGHILHRLQDKGALDKQGRKLIG